MNNYKARWNKAKALALDLNRRREEATAAVGKKAIFLWRGDPVDGDLIIFDDAIELHDGGCINGIFDDDPTLDHGSHTPIKEIEKQFEEFEVYVPWH
jgi:hypothetical protein